MALNLINILTIHIIQTIGHIRQVHIFDQVRGIVDHGKHIKDQPVVGFKIGDWFFELIEHGANLVLTEYTKLFIILIILLRIKYEAD